MNTGRYYIREDGTKGLIRCGECNKENYAFSVSSGICCWCGFDINKKDNDGRSE